MTEAAITTEQIEDLLTKLRALELDGAQRDLLDAILAVAAGLIEVEVEEKSLHFLEDFAGSFTPHQAQLVLAYAHAPATFSMISRHSTGAHPAMISRSTGR